MPIKQKAAVEEKVRIIRRYLESKISLSEGARENMDIYGKFSFSSTR